MIELANRSNNDACRFAVVVCIALFGSNSAAWSKAPESKVHDGSATIVRLAPKILVSAPLPIRDGFDDVVLQEPSIATPAPMSIELMESDIMEFGDTLLPPVSESIQPSRQSNGAIPWLDIRPRNLDADQPSLVSRDDLPADVSGMESQSHVTQWIQSYSSDLTLSDFCRGASFCRHPLYFEDDRLERYGVIAGPLRRFPAIHSGIHFAWRAGALPASMAVDPPCEWVPSGRGEQPLIRRLKSPF